MNNAEKERVADILAGLLTDQYGSLAAHPLRKHRVSGGAYAKLEEIFRGYVKNGQAG